METLLKEKKKRRDYQNNYPSVTTVLSVLRARGLEEWFKRTPYDEILKQSARGKAIGTEIHSVIQSYIETGEAKIDTKYPEEVTNALKSFMKFRKDYPQIKLQRSEMALTSENYRFNGTIDCTADNGEILIADWKTGQAKDKESPAIYDEYKIQVSAYVYLHNETHEEKVNKAIIISVAKDKIGYEFYEMDMVEISDYFNEVFLPALKIYNYQRKEKQNA